jgi:hypothetical protein
LLQTLPLESTPGISSLQSPFFIVGCGRSGTTLLRTMLNHHPDVAVPVESLFIVDYLRAASTISIDVLKRLLISDREFREWNMPVHFEDFDGCTTPRNLIDCIHALYMAQQGKRCWGQKTPRFVRHGALLKAYYPHAKFIHVIRDPRATVSSLIRSDLHRSNPLFGARRWAGDVAAGLALKAQYPDDMLEVRYEELVAAPEVVLRRVCEFLELAFHPTMLEYHHEGTKEYDAIFNAAHSALNESPKADRIDAWRKHLTADDIALIEWVCADIMGQVDYTLDTDPHPPSASTLRRWKLDRAIKLGQQIAHRVIVRPGPLWSFAWRKLRLGVFGRDLREVNY